MTKFLPVLAAGFTLTAASMAHACPGSDNFDAYINAGTRAFDLLGGAEYDVDIGGSIPWSNCGISGDGYLPKKASISMFVNAAEGKQASVHLTSACGTSYMFVQAGDFRGTSVGDPSSGTVSVQIPRSYIGNDQIIMVYLSGDAPGKVCQGKITFQTARG